MTGSQNEHNGSSSSSIPFDSLIASQDPPPQQPAPGKPGILQRSRTATSIFRLGKGSRSNSSAQVAKVNGGHHSQMQSEQAPEQMRSASSASKHLSTDRSSTLSSEHDSPHKVTMHVRDLLASFRHDSSDAIPASRRLTSHGSAKTHTHAHGHVDTISDKQTRPAGSRSASYASRKSNASSLKPRSIDGTQIVSAHSHSNDTHVTATSVTTAGDSGFLSRGAGNKAETSILTISTSASDDDDVYDSPDEFFEAEETPSGLPPTSFSHPLIVSSVPPKALSTASAPVSSATALLQNGKKPPAARPQASLPVPGESQLRADIRQTWYAVNLFLNSRMKDAEVVMLEHHKDRLYYSLGTSLINAMKAMMTFEPTDLAEAVELCRITLDLAAREKSTVQKSWTERIGSAAGAAMRGSGLTTDQVARMTDEQKHAELAYAECLLLKAVVGLMYAGDWLAFLREAFNMRTAHATYRVLQKYVAHKDSIHKGGYDPSIDLDFRSGVSLGTGCISLILSLLPSTAGRIMEIFGFGGNREEALRTLMEPGGWVRGQAAPERGEGPGNEGLRRCVCDLQLLMYHLIISSIMPIPDVDIELAENILKYNLQRYPNGVFWLYFSGRLYSTQTLGTVAIEQYHKAIESEKEYRQIQHIVNWDMGLTYLSLGDYKSAHTSFDILATESNWSKAVYAYTQAVTLYECNIAGDNGKEDSHKDAKNEQRILEIMSTITGHMKKIAGKSLPFEKFVARKSRRYAAQNGHLVLPGLELAYTFQALPLAPRYALSGRHLRQIDASLARLDAQRHASSEHEAWWDDYCLAHLLRGVVLVLVARPEQHVKLDPPECPLKLEEADEQALNSFELIINNATHLTLEHQIAWYAHFELGRLLTRIGGAANQARARDLFQTIIEARVVLGPTKGKGKVSLQSGIILKANAALDSLKKQMGTA